MPIPSKLPLLSDAPAVYDQQWINSQFNELLRAFQLLNDQGSIVASRVRITDLPTSATGLKVGDLWNDAGTVKVKT